VILEYTVHACGHHLASGSVILQFVSTKEFKRFQNWSKQTLKRWTHLLFYFNRIMQWRKTTEVKFSKYFCPLSLLMKECIGAFLSCHSLDFFWWFKCISRSQAAVAEWLSANLDGGQRRQACQALWCCHFALTHNTHDGLRPSHFIVTMNHRTD